MDDQNKNLILATALSFLVILIWFALFPPPATVPDELASEHPDFDPLLHIQRMKKTLIYICDGIDPEFEHAIRRMRTAEEFQNICKAHLDHSGPLPTLPSKESRMFCGFGELLE